MHDATAFHLEGLQNDGEPIPEPSGLTATHAEEAVKQPRKEAADAAAVRAEPTVERYEVVFSGSACVSCARLPTGVVSG
jgi:hypothetical protein